MPCLGFEQVVKERVDAPVYCQMGILGTQVGSSDPDRSAPNKGEDMRKFQGKMGNFLSEGNGRPEKRENLLDNQ
jgi:hypothetical protein